MKPIFIIHALDYTQRSSGIEVLHKLGETLNAKGEEAFLTECRVGPESKVSVIPASKIDEIFVDERPVVAIEPEIFDTKNDFANLTVRWLLNSPGLAGRDVSESWGKDDLLCHFMDFYRRPASIPLFVPHIDRRVFHNDENPNDAKRTIDCFYGRKAKLAGMLNPFPPEVLDLSDENMSLEELADVFRKTRMFYTMEMTACSIQAMLCGAKHKFISNPYQREYPPISDWDAWYADYEKRADGTVEKFIDVCYKRLGLMREAMVVA